jgi:hypothetical protein
MLAGSNALRAAGTEVADLSEPGWRITAENVASMSDLLKEVLEEEWGGEIVIVFQLFDNSSYTVRKAVDDFMFNVEM